MPVDGIAGGATLRELIRLESRHEEPELISSVRARAQLRHAPPTLTGRHVAIGERGGLGSVTGALRRRLVLGGTQVTELHHPDDSTQAHEANDLGVDVFLGLRLNPARAECHTSYWAGVHDESQGGRLLAELIQEIVPGLLGIRGRGGSRHVAGHPARDTHAISAGGAGSGQSGRRARGPFGGCAVHCAGQMG